MLGHVDVWVVRHVECCGVLGHVDNAVWVVRCMMLVCSMLIMRWVCSAVVVALVEICVW